MCAHARITQFHLPRWHGFTWDEACDRSQPSFDRVFITEHPESLRLGALDAAVAPWHDRDQVGADLDAAVEVLGCELDLRSAVCEVNGALVARGEQRGARCSQDNTLVCAAVCDLDLASGEVRALVAGDCEVWVHHGGAWEPLAPGDMLTSAARRRYERGVAAQGAASAWEVQREVLDDPAAWERPYLGAWDPPRCVETRRSQVDAVVVSSDGARLDASRLEDLHGWLATGIHEGPSRPGMPFAHGDISVAAAWRARR